MLYVRADDFRNLKDDADKFDKAIIRGLKKRAKEIGEIGIDAVKAALAETPPNDQPGTAGSRDAIAASLRTTVSFGKRTAGVKITANNSKLDPEHKGFVAAYNSKSLRHPVYGKRDVWVQQPSRPYFGAAITDALRGQLQELMMKAVDEAVAATGAKGK